MIQKRYVAAIDQGTSSTRCVIFDSSINVVSSDQEEHGQSFPNPGWVEHDPEEIWTKVQSVVRGALGKARLLPKDLAAVGITNQRESTLVWDRTTGRPLHNIIVWNDLRTEDICQRLKRNGKTEGASTAGGAGRDRFRKITGLPIATYFSGTKLMWLLENVKGLREKAERGDALFGTVDSWLLWKLTGGQRHVTDVTNASRTLLMDLATLSWSEEMASALGVPMAMLPQIASSAEVYGEATTLLEGVPIAGILGDQQAALFGQTCFEAGQAKCTYGTGAFILMNTGERPVPSTHGLISTVGYKLGDAKAVYALEGSIAYAGSVVQWCRDGLCMIQRASEIETLARSVSNNGGLFFVPAFSGLFAPHWRGDARGTVCGLTSFVNRGHLARAILEATAYQVSDVLEAMRVDSDVTLQMLKVDGGMTANTLLMQFQADILDKEVVRPKVSETTSLGAAFAAGLAVGVWSSVAELRGSWQLSQQFVPQMAGKERLRLLRCWNRALNKSLGWTDDASGSTATAAAAADACGVAGRITPPHQQPLSDKVAAPRGSRRAVLAAGALLSVAAGVAGYALGRQQRQQQQQR